MPTAIPPQGSPQAPGPKAVANLPGWLQCPGKIRTFNDMMNTLAAVGFRHLRRFRIAHPGWVAV